MKKLLVAFSLVLASVAMLAQKDVTSAYNANKNGEYDKAASYIESAITNPKANVKDKTWRYRGNIYLNIANSEEFAPKYPDAIKTASDSYMKAMELDTKDTYKQEDTQRLVACKAMSMNSGINNYNEGNYELSAGMFELGAGIAKNLNETDTLAYFNAALAHEKSGNIENAITNYNECGELGYQVPEVYLFIASLQRNELGDKEAALETLKAARVKYPKHPGLVIEELNIYLTDGNFENAQENLRVAIENDPENPILHFSIGSVYDNLDKKDEAVVAYLKSIEFDPEYFDANYNLGALYFNQAVELVNKANEIPANQNSKYKAAMEEANAVFANALPYLEKAYTLNDTDEGTIRSLKDIYIRVGDDEKYLIFKDQLENVVNGTPVNNSGGAVQEPSITADVSTTKPNEQNELIIPMTEENGIYTIPCKVNGLDFSFYYDSGASSVSIGLDVLSVMIRQDKISKSDFLGTSYSSYANGEVGENIVVNIKELEIGGLVLTNIEANASGHLSTPLLLGQSVLNQFSSVTQDTENMILRLKLKD